MRVSYLGKAVPKVVVVVVRSSLPNKVPLYYKYSLRLVHKVVVMSPVWRKWKRRW